MECQLQCTRCRTGCLERSGIHQKNQGSYHAGRKYLEDELTKLGCTLAKPCANFIYFDTHHDPKEIRAALAERKIMISAFGFNRVSVGTKEQNKAFIAALKEILAAY